MKKLTTNQMLIGGGVIALIYILYKKKQGQNGSNMIKDAMSGDLTEVSQSEGDKTPFTPEISIPTGETKYPIKPKKPNRPQKGNTVDRFTHSKECTPLLGQWKLIQAKTKWANEKAMIEARNKFLGNCIRPYPVFLN
tara:strand:- start:320 stop:730 length:411 start_codon:yes stop_codon:yes gene_type:complete